MTTATSRTLAQDIRATITELDRLNSGDEAYRQQFSTFTKQRLRKGETWRLRLLLWCEREELAEVEAKATTEATVSD